MPLPHVPGYRFLRFLGGGSLFQVWEARAVDDTVPVAVKLIRDDALDHPNALTLLRRDARAGLAVRHPRLVRVLRSHVFEEPHYVVFELVLGESLRDRLKRKPLGRRAAVWSVRQAAEGVAALHRAGFVHADVKPGNVIVAPSGEAKLIDCGFSYKRGENRRLLGAGFVLGTANYLAPELCRKPVKEGPAVDVFALGVSLFECLTGKLPYPGETADDVIRAHRERPPLDLADMPGEWPDRLVQVSRALLAADPWERPTAARVVRELAGVELEMMRRPVSTAASRGRPSRPTREYRRTG
jgi:serine/threonine protein kinase